MRHKTTGCGTSRKYKNIRHFYSVKYYKHFKNSIYAVKIHLWSKRSVYLGTFNVPLNYAFSCLWMGKSEEIYGL